MDPFKLGQVMAEQSAKTAFVGSTLGRAAIGSGIGGASGALMSDPHNRGVGALWGALGGGALGMASKPLMGMAQKHLKPLLSEGAEAAAKKAPAAAKTKPAQMVGGAHKAPPTSAAKAPTTTTSPAPIKGTKTKRLEKQRQLQQQPAPAAEPAVSIPTQLPSRKQRSLNRRAAQTNLSIAPQGQGLFGFL